MLLMTTKDNYFTALRNTEKRIYNSCRRIQNEFLRGNYTSIEKTCHVDRINNYGDTTDPKRTQNKGTPWQKLYKMVNDKVVNWFANQCIISYNIKRLKSKCKSVMTSLLSHLQQWLPNLGASRWIQWGTVLWHFIKYRNV